MIRISAKGPAANVKRAAARHGVALRNVTTSGPFKAVRADAACKSLTKVMRWMNDPAAPSDGRSGRGAAPGTLLFYSIRDCDSGDLRGARSRKRKGRR